MEARRPRNRHPSSSSSFSQSTRPRPQKPPSNLNQHAKFSPSTDSNTSRCTQQEYVGGDAEGSSNFGSLVGTCPYMCPGMFLLLLCGMWSLLKSYLAETYTERVHFNLTEKERIQRERLRDLAVFERINGNPGKSSPGHAVKKFCRTISTKDVQASDVRPLLVLEDTIKHLLSLLDSKDHPFEAVHDFIFDRTRSIRQDLSMQNISDGKASCMYEEIVRFHVVSHHKLRCHMSDPNIASMHHLNLEQLTKTLTSLFNLYDENRDSNHVFENEAEFRSLYVLLHLGSSSKPTGESLSFWLSHVSASVLRSKEMCFARRILRSFRIGNYKNFCRTAAQASYLQYCILEPYINEVRAMALSCINFGGYKLHPYPLVDLSKLLMMKESDVVSFCNACGLETCTDESGNKLLPTKQTTFSHPQGGFQSYNFLGLEAFER